MWALVIGGLLVGYGVILAFIHGASIRDTAPSTILQRGNNRDRHSDREAA